MQSMQITCAIEWAKRTKWSRPDPLTDDIVFALGFRLTPKVQRYKPGEGMIGKSFTENRHFNEADVRNVPSYKPSREDNDPPYKAVLCEPVRWNDEPIGIITVDRSEAGFFDYVAEQVAQGLASQCALAVKIYEASQAAASTSSRDEPAPEPG
jgi:GAF domain-containing protein